MNLTETHQETALSRALRSSLLLVSGLMKFLIEFWFGFRRINPRKRRTTTMKLNGKLDHHRTLAYRLPQGPTCVG